MSILPKYKNLLEVYAKKENCEINYSEPILVNGGMAPPPCRGLPGTVCYMVVVTVNSLDFFGFGPSASLARHYAEKDAYKTVVFEQAKMPCGNDQYSASGQGEEISDPLEMCDLRLSQVSSNASDLLVSNSSIEINDKSKDTGLGLAAEETISIGEAYCAIPYDSASEEPMESESTICKKLNDMLETLPPVYQPPDMVTWEHKIMRRNNVIDTLCDTARKKGIRVTFSYHRSRGSRRANKVIEVRAYGGGFMRKGSHFRKSMAKCEAAAKLLETLYQLPDLVPHCAGPPHQARLEHSPQCREHQEQTCLGTTTQPCFPVTMSPPGDLCVASKSNEKKIASPRSNSGECCRSYPPSPYSPRYQPPLRKAPLLPTPPPYLRLPVGQDSPLPYGPPPTYRRPSFCSPPSTPPSHHNPSCRSLPLTPQRDFLLLPTPHPRSLPPPTPRHHPPTPHSHWAAHPHGRRLQISSSESESDSDCEHISPGLHEVVPSSYSRDSETVESELKQLPGQLEDMNMNDNCHSHLFAPLVAKAPQACDQSPIGLGPKQSTITMRGVHVGSQKDSSLLGLAESCHHYESLTSQGGQLQQRPAVEDGERLEEDEIHLFKNLSASDPLQFVTRLPKKRNNPWSSTHLRRDQSIFSKQRKKDISNTAKPSSLAPILSDLNDVSSPGVEDCRLPKSMTLPTRTACNYNHLSEESTAENKSVENKIANDAVHIEDDSSSGELYRRDSAHSTIPGSVSPNTNVDTISQSISSSSLSEGQSVSDIVIGESGCGPADSTGGGTKPHKKVLTVPLTELPCHPLLALAHSIKANSSQLSPSLKSSISLKFKNYTNFTPELSAAKNAGSEASSPSSRAPPQWSPLDEGDKCVSLPSEGSLRA